MKVVILHDEIPPDARPDELDALIQADSISKALMELGHQPASLGFSLNLREVELSLARLRPDLVFNLVESVAGQGRLIYLAPSLLDCLKIPYTGAGTDAMFSTSHKLLAKQLMASHGIPTPSWYTDRTLGDVVFTAGSYIIKLVWEDASLGIEDDSVVDVKNAAGLGRILTERADRLKGEVFAEHYIDGREFNLSLLVGGEAVEVLPPAEIRFVDFAPGKPRIVGYRAKWEESSHEYHHTPRCFDFSPVDRPLLDELCRVARECRRIFGLTGYARVDFRVDAAGQPWILEVNANPCLAPDAGFAAAADQAGICYTRMIARLLEDAIQRFS